MPEGNHSLNPSLNNDIAGNSKRARRKLGLLRFITFILPVLIIGLAVGLTMGMSAFKPKPEEKEDAIKAVPVLTAKAYQGDITLKVKAQGEVQPRTEINIVPQISGLITYMSPKFIEGGKFRKGDVLVRMDPAEFKLRVIQARANVAQAETVLTREKSEALIAKQDWEEIGSGNSASALTLRQPQMAEAAAQLESARARLAEAELMLGRTTLLAPFDGRVTLRNIDQGEFVSAGTRLGQVYATDVMDVRLPLSNKDLEQAGLVMGYEARGNKGIPVTLSADVGGRFSQWTGHIVRTDSRFDSQTRVLYAYAEIKDPFGAGSDDGTPLAPGLFVEAAIEGQKLTDVIFIPRAALRGENQAYLVKDGNSLSISTVNVVSSNRENAILNGGVNPGDLVITSPIRGVAEGMRIDVVARKDSGDAP